MTLIALHYSDNHFWALSDSRASHSPLGEVKKIIDRLTKTYIVNYRFTSESGMDDYRQDVKGEVGFAFSGDILVALALKAMSATLLENMHDLNGRSDPPTFEIISNIFLKSAELLHDETILNARPFQAFIFGFCPSTRKPHISYLNLTQENSLYKYSIVNLDVSKNITYSMGSGSKFFKQLLADAEENGEPLEDVFYNAVCNNPDPGTGGAVQILKVYNGYAFVSGVLQPDTNNLQLENYFAGVGGSEIGSIGGYTVGRKGISVALSKLKEQIDPIDFSKIDLSKVYHGGLQNIEAFKRMLSLMMKDKYRNERLDGSIYVKQPQPVKGKMYFSKICGNCFRLSPLIQDISLGAANNRFVGFGIVNSNCIYCNHRVYISANELVSRKWL